MSLRQFPPTEQVNSCCFKILFSRDGAVGTYAALCLGEGPPRSQSRRAFPHWFRVKYVCKCGLDDIALRQSCCRLLLTGAGCIFHLDLFHPEFFDNEAAAVPPLRPSYPRN